METLSFIALILLSLVGYSIGAVSRAGKLAQLKPQSVDLIIISFIWAGAICSSVIFDLNRWLLIIAWVILSSILGILAVWPRKLPVQETSDFPEPVQSYENAVKRLWQRWKNFSGRMGEFQSKIFISLFYFIFFSLFALAVRGFSDPLRIKKYRANHSYWLLKARTEADIEQFRRQF